MPNTRSAKKRVRQNRRHRARNRWRKQRMRGAIKTASERILHGSAEEAEAAFRKACSEIDRAARRGVIHRNNAARKKSQLNARLKTAKTTGS